MQHTLVAVFDNQADAQQALQELVSSGFSRNDVSVSSAGSATQSTGASGAMSPGDSQDEDLGTSIKHFFSNLFGSDGDEHASRYAGAVNSGNHVLTVKTDSESEVERAADTIERFGPVDIDERHEGSNPGSAMGMMSAGDGNSSSGTAAMQSGSPQQGSMQRAGTASSADERGAAIPVIQEQLKVGKREVQRGGVRVFSRVVETPVNESVSLREEHVSVERRPVDQPLSAADGNVFKEQSIELRERAEEAVVEKSARVVEEVVVGKETTERQENIADTVRHTEVQVEQLGGASAQDDTYYRQHFTSNYASGGSSFDDYAPAYRYGTQMRGDSRYAGKQWADVEPNLRSDWESRNGSGGESTWEKMKAAVRHGWEKIVD